MSDAPKSAPKSRKWLKAGVRADPHERARIAREYVANGNKAAIRHNVAWERAMKIGQRKWAEGLVIPAHITLALDAGDHFGPEVDAACLAEEPEVDLWELGKLYPKWEQLVALAQLTGKLPDMFMAPVRPAISMYETSMRFHTRPQERPNPPVVRFSVRAMTEARKLGAHV